ncbi:hypothetical protein AG1IA_10352 [Rhizoctonia solani AG-1 IA]|uniref:Uncharacterized protein n=1 Tax=Thanatephorus cucumeris (strain AG1-IA) TaxID=983506 RepID=L8WFQ4_THACA|nr:hypothetical protein AG1IA_10352 [Rhizoctonia solani AG-1 IA]
MSSGMGRCVVPSGLGDRGKTREGANGYGNRSWPSWSTGVRHTIFTRDCISQLRIFQPRPENYTPSVRILYLDFVLGVKSRVKTRSGCCTIAGRRRRDL